MPGKTPAEAVHQYLEPIQQSLSCVTDLVIRPSGYDVGMLQTATFNALAAELLTQREEILYLTFRQTFSITKPLLGKHKIKTRSYEYGLENAHNREIFLFHWHPESQSGEVDFPHLHIKSGAATELRPEFFDIHFRTDRVALEDFLMMLLRNFRVVPNREDAEEVLERNLKKFRAYRTWASYL